MGRPIGLAVTLLFSFLLPAIVSRYDDTDVYFWSGSLLYAFSFAICVSLILDKKLGWYALLLLIFTFGGYFKSLVAMWSFANNDDLLTVINPEWENVTIDMVHYAFFVSGLVFLLTSSAFSRFMSTRDDADSNMRHLYNRDRIALVLFCTFTLGMVSILVRGLLGIGVMGMAAEQNIFHTVLFRLQSHALPAVFIALLWAAKQSRADTLLKLTASAFLIFLTANSLVSSSKAGIFAFIMIMFFSSIYFLEIERKHGAYIIIAAIIGLIFYVYSGNIRVERLNGADLWQAISNASNSEFNLFSKETWGRILQIPMRIIGVDGLWYFKAAGDYHSSLSYLDVFSFDNGVTEYFTREIVGVTVPDDFRSPGFITTFYMLGELPIVILGSLVLMIAINYWIAAFRSTHYFHPIAVYTMAFTFILLVDGALNPKDVISFLLASAGMVFVLSYLAGNAGQSGESLPAAQINN